MRDLEMNKIAAAVLVAGIVAMVAGIAAEKMYHGGGHGGHEEKRGYTIAGAEEASSGEAGAPAEPEKPVDIAAFLAKADVKAGEATAKKCTACHTFEKGGKNGVGPNQWGLLGNHFAHKEDYSYSAAFTAKKSEKWTFQQLSDFLANPKAVVPGNKMAYAGLKKPEERANLIAYINSMSDSPLPLPK